MLALPPRSAPSIIAKRLPQLCREYGGVLGDVFSGKEGMRKDAGGAGGGFEGFKR